MFAIAFDLSIDQTEAHHPKGAQQAYTDIRKTLERNEFRWVQGSVYVTDREDMGGLVRAILSLKAMKWFAPSVRDIRAFRVENWSDFTAIVKSDD